MKKGWVLLAVLAVMATGIGCASAPPDRPDADKIQRSADEAFEALQQQEDRRLTDD